MAVMIAPREDDKAESPGTGATDLGGRVTGLELKVDGLSAKMDERFEQVDRRFERIDERFAETLREMKAGFERMLYAMLTATVLIITALITAPHL